MFTALEDKPKLLKRHRVALTYMRIMFLTLKLSRGATSGSSPLSSCRTICWRILSKSCQCCRLQPPRLSEMEDKSKHENVKERWDPCTILEHLDEFEQSWFWTPPQLTGHLQAVLKDWEEMRVGICVAQFLLDQLKHGTSTLCIYMGLKRKWKENIWLAQSNRRTLQCLALT